ncbi:uncharacterized protein [Saccopteryx bilineata]|uniref:uncharacterized protein n=1 Tax=Saccopteryx bilineata TaxID=59482 RepID=UPI00338EDFCB
MNRLGRPRLRAPLPPPAPLQRRQRRPRVVRRAFPAPGRLRKRWESRHPPGGGGAGRLRKRWESRHPPGGGGAGRLRKRWESRHPPGGGGAGRRRRRTAASTRFRLPAPATRQPALYVYKPEPESEICEAAAGDMVAVTPSPATSKPAASKPAAPEPAELDFGSPRGNAFPCAVAGGPMAGSPRVDAFLCGWKPSGRPGGNAYIDLCVYQRSETHQDSTSMPSKQSDCSETTSL